MAVDENGRPDFAALFTAAPESVQFWRLTFLKWTRDFCDVSAARKTPRANACVLNPPEGYLLFKTFEDAKAL